MNFLRSDFEKKNLERALKLAETSLGDTSRTKNFRVSFKENKMDIFASNEKSNIQVSLDIEHKGKSFTFCVDGKRFSNAIQVLDQDTLNLEITLKSLKIKSGKFEGSLNILPDSEESFLGKELVVEKFQSNYNTKHFLEALQFMKSFPSADYSINDFKSILEMRDGWFLAGDGSRIGEYVTKLKGKCKIPHYAISDIVSILSKEKEDSFSLEEIEDKGISKSVLRVGRVQYDFRTIATSIPETVWTSLANFTSIEDIKGDKMALVAILKKIQPYLNTKSDKIDLLIGSETLNIVATNDQGYKCQESCEITRTKPYVKDYQIRIDYKKLLDILEIIPGKELNMSFNQRGIVKIHETKAVATITTMLMN